MSAVEDLIAELDGSPEAAERLVQAVRDEITNQIVSSPLLRASHELQQRWMNSGTPIVTDTTGVSRDVTGEAYFDVINVIGGAGFVNAANPRQLDLSLGAGADCMFDYLVSSCFATLAGFTEGQTFTPLSGCTFKGYSTVTGAVTQAAIDFPSTTPAVIFVCGGTYLEANITTATNQYLHIIGSGRDRTVIGGATSANPTFNATATGCRLWTSEITWNVSSGGYGMRFDNAGNLRIQRCKFNSAASLTRFGLYINNQASGFDFLIEECQFDDGDAIRVSGSNSTGMIADSVFRSCTLGILAFEDMTITNNFFSTCTTGIAIDHIASDVSIINNRWKNGTTAIALGSGASQAQYISAVDNDFDSITTFIDASALSTGASGNNDGWVIDNNRGSLSGTLIALPVAATLQKSWIITDNLVRSTGGATAVSLTTGAALYIGMVAHGNHVDTSTQSSNSIQLEPVHGGTSQFFTSDLIWVEDDVPLTIGVTAHTARFGDTAVQVTRQVITCTIDVTNYIYVDSAGTLTKSTSAFPAGVEQLAQIVCSHSGANATYVSHTPVAGTHFIGAGPFSGSGGFPTKIIDADGSTYVDVEKTADSDIIEFASDGTIRARMSALGLEMFNGTDINLYSDAGSTQQGQWDAATGHIGVNSAASANVVLLLGTNFTDPASDVTGIQSPIVLVMTAGNARVVTGVIGQVTTSGAFTASGQLVGIRGTVQIGNASNASTVRSVQATASFGVGGTTTDRYGLYVANGTGTGTLTNQYGVHIENMTKGGTLNRAIHSLGGVSDILGAVTIGANAAPVASAILDLTSTTQGLLPPRMTTTQRDAIASPATGLVIFNTTTGFLNYYDGAAWNALTSSTEHHVFMATMDVTTASTTVPYQLVGPFAATGTITGVEAVAGANLTNGATSSIFDVHLIPAANVNTDGQGTTIFTTQANRPTITNGNKKSTTTAPDVTAVAAGDYLAAYTDQSGTTLTFATVSVKVTYP